MYAIIEEGGKQFKVTSGDTILIDREASDGEKSIKFARVLLIGGEGEPKIGLPTLEKATVSADEKEAARLGVQGTPTFFVNGRRIIGAQPLAAFQDRMERALGETRLQE